MKKLELPSHRVVYVPPEEDEPVWVVSPKKNLRTRKVPDDWREEIKNTPGVSVLSQGADDLEVRASMETMSPLRRKLGKVLLFGKVVHPILFEEHLRIHAQM